MLNWEERPFEIANLVNPAFCSLLLHISVGDFFKEKRNGMPYALLFLILPLTLHEPTREALPADTRTLLTEWFKEQPEEFGRIFADQVRQFVPYTREALIFGMQRSLFDIDENGNITHNTGHLNSAYQMKSPVVTIMNSARFVGRWFAKLEHESLIFKIFGICL